VRGSSELVASGRHLHFAAFLSGSSRHNRSSASARTQACLHHDHTFRCRPCQATSVLHEQFAMPLDFVCGFLLNDLRRPSRAAPLFSPCGSAPSRRAAASRALSSVPAPSPTALLTPPHTCACAFQHRELRAQARPNRSTTRRWSRIRTRTTARRRLARLPFLVQGPCTHHPCAAHAVSSPLLAPAFQHLPPTRLTRAAPTSASACSCSCCRSSRTAPVPTAVPHLLHLCARQPPLELACSHAHLICAPTGQRRAPLAPPGPASACPSRWLTSGSRATPEPPRAPHQLHLLGPRSPRAEPPAATRSLRRRPASLRPHASSLTRTRAEPSPLQRPAPGPRVRALRPRGPLAARAGPAPRASMPLVKPRATARGPLPRPSARAARAAPVSPPPPPRARVLPRPVPPALAAVLLSAWAGGRESKGNGIRIGGAEKGVAGGGERQGAREKAEERKNRGERENRFPKDLYAI
jgi:hypothetical protein